MPGIDPLVIPSHLSKSLKKFFSSLKMKLWRWFWLVTPTAIYWIKNTFRLESSDHLLPSHNSTGIADVYISQTLHKRIIELFDAYGLKELIKFPTRETLQTSTLIDHAVISEPRNFIDSGVIKISPIDHHIGYYFWKFFGALARQQKNIMARQIAKIESKTREILMKLVFFDGIFSIDWNFSI